MVEKHRDEINHRVAENDNRVIKFMGFEELVQNYKSYEDVLIKY
jgi:hypothetical protein